MFKHIWFTVLYEGLKIQSVFFKVYPFIITSLSQHLTSILYIHFQTHH